MSLATIHAQCSDAQLIEVMTNERYDQIEVTGHPKTLDDITRVQAYCDAYQLTATWSIGRHARKVYVKLQRPEVQLDFGGMA